MRKRTLLRVLTFVLTLCTSYSHAQQQCVTIRCNPYNSMNADVLSYLPTRINAACSYFLADDWTYSGTAGESRDLMRIDLSAIPNGATINSALLTLYADSTNGTGYYGSPMYGTGNAAYLRRVTETWVDATVNWNNQPATTTLNQVSLAQSTNTIQNYPNIDITAFVQNWVNNPAENYGMMLQLQNLSTLNSMTFCSGNYPDSTLWPTLVVCYTPASANCTTVIITADSTNSINNDVLSYLPTRVYAQGPYFLADDWTYSNTPGESRDVMKIDLSAIPGGATVNSALLNLYADSTNGTGDYGSPMYGTGNASYLRQVTSSWDGNTVDWNNQPTTTTANEVLLPQSTSAIENYLNIDITAFVQNWVSNPSQNYGMMLQIQTVAYLNSMTFCSGNYPDSTLRPTLAICYSVGAAISEVEEPAILNIFPNPTNSTINIQLQGGAGIDEVKLYNALGQQVLAEKAGQDKLLSLDVAQLPKGVYLAKVTDKSGKAFYGKEVVE